ncbi:hypothetical protein BofuT4_P152810.1 [Botrytis cinerea T4]|uniref:Uncharacterized protein n=1 Tax=Botryotinia fuckeliana (strain T4) TaxID=999810 RepID=G2YVS1_BOTF4|nr:hypothetical protein BofuT4_P152810.1 [Botrytis cinerea T4]
MTTPKTIELIVPRILPRLDGISGQLRRLGSAHYSVPIIVKNGRNYTRAYSSILQYPPVSSRGLLRPTFNAAVTTQLSQELIATKIEGERVVKKDMLLSRKCWSRHTPLQSHHV